MSGSIASMTGFARLEGAHDRKNWAFEIKSVNARGLETRFRLPSGLDALEKDFRRILQQKIRRGSVFVSMQMSTDSADAQMQLNEAALNDALAAIAAIRSKIDCDPPRAESILALRGVLEQASEDVSEEDQAALAAAVTSSFTDAVDALCASRTGEGVAMGAALTQHLDEIERLTALASSSAGATPAAIRDRIAAQLADLLQGAGLPEDRLAQEAALMAVKADVREELDRLTAHIAAGRALLARDGAIGREFDFLTQEFNREANTLCSKAQDMALKSVGLDLKKTIDQLREQVQNIEQGRAMIGGDLKVARRGLMFILSSPSGAGKTTLAARLLNKDDELTLSVSATTRARRPGEAHGTDYYFVSEDEFVRMRENEELLEWANVFGNFYGTPRKLVEDTLTQGKDVLFDIDWQGAQQLDQVAGEDVVKVFILPPSREELERRLRQRAQDTEDVMQKRMAKADAEISHWAEYDYVIVNYDLDESEKLLRSILFAERLKRRRQIGLAAIVKSMTRED